MERSTYSLTYKGSISDAIIEAQKQKKLFVVYISGEDENSINLEQSTWVDLTVAETISKYCIFLHLIQGSVGASQFSEIYSPKSVPSMSAVGYNGLLLWQHEGYINAEDLVGSIQKAWAALHLQETAATLLSAALASNKSEPLGSSSHNVALVEDGVSSTSDIPSNSAEKPAEGLEARPLTDPKHLVEERVCESRDDQKDAKPVEETCSQLNNVNDIKIDREEQSSSASNTIEEVLYPVGRDVDYSGTSNDGGVSTERQENLTLDESHATISESVERMATVSPGYSEITGNEVVKISHGKKVDYYGTSNDGGVSTERQENLTLDDSHTTISESVERMVTESPGYSEITGNKVVEISHGKKVDGLIDCSNALKTNDIHLNIRLPNGSSLQAKFTVTNTLRSVKNYIDENQIGGIGSYDLAVPYPRKVFNEQDMNNSLSELGFASRQALIAVPRHRAAGRPRAQAPPNAGQYTVSESDSGEGSGGYFGYVKRVFSYMNPFSYLGGNAGSSSSEAAPSGGIWQYRPNPSPQNQLSAAEAPRRANPSSSQSPLPGENVDKKRRSTSRPFGSNIHTLREDEDKGPSGDDRNTFWNGNSTQYGGNDK